MIAGLGMWCGGSVCLAQPAQDGLLKIGGFRCVDLQPLKNDSTYNLYDLGYWSYASFRMDVWKRHGIPFWYPRDTGNVRVAGAEWQAPDVDMVSAASAGAVAHADSQQPGNGAIPFAHDGDPTTYWYAGDGRPHGKLWIEFGSPARVQSVRFLGWATPRHAPKDYAIGLIRPDGGWQEVGAVRDEKRMGEWIDFPMEAVEAQGIYLDVQTTGEGEHGPVIYELQARGEWVTPRPGFPTEVVIPLGGATAQEMFFLGQVGTGFDPSPEARSRVGEYVLTYENGTREVILLIAGENVADARYGHFVPAAEVAFVLRDTTEAPGTLAYHLDEMVPVEPKKQLMMMDHALAHPDRRLQSLTFRCTDAKASLVLAGLTLCQSGPRLNALVYNGRRIRPYPRNTPPAKPSPISARLGRSRILPLDGPWRYTTDPGNQGIRKGYCQPQHAMAGWKEMPVPSQWYVQGLDYHGVVWFRREFHLPASFPGSVLELHFGGVDYEARVWVNGQYVGRHVGAYAAFQLDATLALRKGARNVLVVRVDSPLDPGFSARKTLIKGNSMDDIAMPYAEEGCMGGIFRSVQLVGRGEVGLENVWTVSTVSEDLRQAEVRVRLELNPARPSAGAVRVKCRLTEPKLGHARPRRFEAEKTVTVAGRTPVELTLHLENPKLWFPWEQGTPHLHLLEIEVWRGGELLDRHVSRVGVREVSFNDQENYVLVNHHRVFIKGMLNDDIHWMSLMDRTGYAQRVRLQKEANLNLIRLVGHQSSPDLYDLCDEMGMMIWQEMPLQWGYSSAEPIRQDILNVVRETVVQCRPHASVIGWSAWNEGGQPEFSSRITASIRELDATRPLTPASGGGFDIHIYPNIILPQLSRRTFFWSGIRVGFVSEVGAYGLSSLEEMKEILGSDHLFPFDSAEYYWETFHSYRYNDGPVFWDAPPAADWPTAKIREYVLSKIEPSQRWLSQFMKFMFENFRAQRFEPTTAAIHCRFDDPFPTAFLGIVNFTGRPRQAYYAVREACQPVLPILFFDYVGVEDLRVVNDYGQRGWTGCTLRYSLTTRSGQTIRQGERPFDLPPDSTVKVLTRSDLGDVFGQPDGFRAELTVLDSAGEVLSKNHYDVTGEEIEAFVTSVYPVPPVEPYRSLVVKAVDATETRGVVRRVDAEDTYGQTLLALGGEEPPYLRYTVNLPQEGDYLVRVAGNSGATLRTFDLFVDGHKAELENYPYTEMTLGMTRLPYSAYHLSWYPGWSVRLAPGRHDLEFRWTRDAPAPTCLWDAIGLQHARAGGGK